MKKVKRWKVRITVAGYVIFFILMVVLALGWWYFSKYIEVNIPTEVVEYCSEKYKGEFEWVSFDLERSTASSRMSVISDGIVEFHVDRYYDVEDNLYYSDDYYSHLFRDSLESRLRRLLPSGCDISLCTEKTIIREVNVNDVNDILSSPDTSLVFSVVYGLVPERDWFGSVRESLGCDFTIVWDTGTSVVRVIANSRGVVFR